MIALDLSRLLSRAGRETPTGIDRVELAYAEHLITTDASACFSATTALGGLGPALPPARSARRRGAFSGAPPAQPRAACLPAGVASPSRETRDPGTAQL